MIRAYALYVVLLISILIGIISGSFILHGYFQRSYQIINFSKFELIDNCQSAYELVQSEEYETPTNLRLDLFGSGEDSAQIIKKDWGIFNVVGAKSISKGNSKTRIALKGPAANDGNELYITDNRSTLTVSGSSILRGKLKVPHGLLDKSTSSSLKAAKNALLGAYITESEHRLLSIRNRLRKKLLSPPIIEKTNFDSDSIKNSFFNNTRYLYSKLPIRVDGHYSGNIIIYSETSVTVSGESILRDVLIYAPSIIIKEDFTGSIQAFAEDSIIIEDNSNLAFPSVFCLVQQEMNKPSFIRIGQSSISGVVICIQKNKGGTLPEIKGSNVTINGTIYNEGISIISGSINGNLFSEKIASEVDGNLMLDHFYNLRFNYESNKNIKYSADLTDGKYAEVLKWL